MRLRRDGQGGASASGEPIGARMSAGIGAAMALWIALAAAPAWSAALPFTGTLSLQIGPYGVGVGGEGVAEVPAFGHLTALGIPAGAFATQGLVVDITETAAFPIAGLQVTGSNATGEFANPGGGIMPLAGSVRVCLFGACPAAVANLTVPLSVVGQEATATIDGSVNVTVQGAPWTVGTAQIGSATAMGFAFGPGEQTSSTARASGRIQLVTPIRILTNFPGDLAVVPAFGILTLHFVPEPTTLLLLGAGLVAIGVRARQR